VRCLEVSVDLALRLHSRARTIKSKIRSDTQSVSKQMLLERLRNSQRVNSERNETSELRAERERLLRCRGLYRNPFVLWGVPCRLDRILVGGIPFWIYTLFNFLNFDWEVCYGVASIHSSGIGFTIAYWQSRLEIVYSVCFLSWD